MAFFKTGVAERILMVAQGGRYGWFMIFGAFILVSWIATHVAHTASSLFSQYMALTAYVIVEAIIFAPMLYLANHFAPGAIQSAGVITIGGFIALTSVVWITGKDFSFLRGMLVWGGVLALVAIGASIIFGAALGTWFSVAMVGLAGCAILFDTSNIFYHYREDQAVGAALQLFASVAMMFWYVLRIFMSRD